MGWAADLYPNNLKVQGRNGEQKTAFPREVKVGWALVAAGGGEQHRQDQDHREDRKQDLRRTLGALILPGFVPFGLL